jgi:predicted  nucleic acid-binding Zn-ribbon protein
MFKEKTNQIEKAEGKIEEQQEKIHKGKQREKELTSKLIKEKNKFKETTKSFNDQIKEIESENIKLKGSIKTMKK